MAEWQVNAGPSALLEAFLPVGHGSDATPTANAPTAFYLGTWAGSGRRPVDHDAHGLGDDAHGLGDDAHGLGDDANGIHEAGGGNEAMGDLSRLMGSVEALVIACATGLDSLAIPATAIGTDVSLISEMRESLHALRGQVLLVSQRYPRH